MKLANCPKCQSQFDVSGMEPGSAFVCGRCGAAITVPKTLSPVLKPLPQSGTQMPATVALTPAQMRKALDEARTPAPGAPPSAAASASASPKLPKAMQKRAAAKDTTAPARAASAPSTEPAAASRKPAQRAGAAKSARPAKPAMPAKPARAASSASSASSSRRSSQDSSAGAGSKKPLIIGVSVGAALLIVVGVMISMSGGKQDADTAGGDTAADTSGANTAGGAGGDTAAVTAATGGAGAATNTSGGGSNGAVAAAQPATPADEWEVFAKLSSGERESDVLQRLNKAKGDPAALKSIYDWFSNDKLKANKEARDGAEMAAREARKTDGSLEWVRSALGESNGLALLNKCLAESPKAFEFAQDDELKLKELATELEGDEWVDAKRYKELEALVARITAREASLSADPRLVQVEVIEKELRKKPVFANLKFIRTFADPYVIFQEYPEILGPDGKPDPGKAHVNKQRLEKARLLAARDGLIFQELNRQFLSLFGDRFKLNGTLKENNRLLVCVMLWDREKFDKWNQEEGSGIGPGVRAYYSPTQKVIMHYVGDEAMKAQDEFPCDGDRVQKQSDQVTFHEGTHQLMHEYSNIFVGTPLKDGVVSVRMGRTMWFDEGLAEFMGAAELDRESLTTLEGAKWSHNRVLLERIELVRRPGMREAAKKWTIANLIQPDSNQTMASKSSELLPGNQLLMINLFYARGWGLVHFCWFYDNGKYRENFLKYMEGVLKGEFGPKEFAKAFGRPNENDWGTMDDEFNWYWDELASRRCGRKINRATGQPSSEWFVAETAPPVGVYDPNEGPGIDFGDDE